MSRGKRFESARRLLQFVLDRPPSRTGRSLRPAIAGSLHQYYTNANRNAPSPVQEWGTAREPVISIDDIGKRVAEGSLAPNRIDGHVKCGRMMARLRRG